MSVIRLSRMHYPVTALGPGTRIGIWVQGCSIGCRGCLSRDTWDPDGGVEVAVDDVLAQCRRWADWGPVGGVTISGGEPFEQSGVLLALLDGLGAWRETLPEPADLLCYSGYPEARLRRDHPELLARLDAVIPGPYVRAATPGGPWRGSANQSIVPLTPLGRLRYSGVPDDPPEAPAMQVVVDDGCVWMVGVPRPGDLDLVEARLRERGVLLGAPSWR